MDRSLADKTNVRICRDPLVRRRESLGVLHTRVVAPTNLLDVFVDAAALWEIAAAEGGQELIDTATQALVDGLDTPSLGELAGFSGLESYWTLHPIVESALRELSLAFLTGEAAQSAALRAMCRRLERQRVDERQLAAWAANNLGWDGPPESEMLVQLNAAYSEIGVLQVTAAELHASVRKEAHRLLKVRS